MKKQLLIIFFFLGSCFFVSAQLDLRGVNINTQTGTVGVNGSIDGVNVSAQAGQAGISGSVNGSIDGVNFNVGNTGGQYQGLLGLIALAQTVVVRLAPLLIGLAVLAFFWFIIVFIWKGGENPEVRAKMQAGMMWSVVAIFVMVSIWGLVSFIGNILGISQGGGMTGFRLPGQ